MAGRDFYEVLGATRTASADDLKRAYRRLAKEYHPDRNSGDAAAEARFKEINEAYDVLKDPEQRQVYDRLGHEAFVQRAQGGGASPGFDFGFGSSFGDIFDEMFGDLGGRRRGRGGRRSGADMRYNMRITLEEAFKGKQATIEVPGTASCDSCSGTGSAGGAPPVTCSTCNGGRPDQGEPGLLHRGAHLRGVPGVGRDGARPLPDLFGPRPGPAHAHAHGHHPGGRRGGKPHPPCRRRRRRRTRRPAGRPLHLPRRRGPSDVRPGRAAHPLRGSRVR